MIKQTLILISAITMLIATNGFAQKAATKVPQKITIKGTVKFNDPKFKMSIYQTQGFDKVQIAEFDINPDGTYKYEMEVKEPGVYTLDCKKWESIRFWAENENIEVDFRGMDTAKMKIKNPPYHVIKGGPLNEVMNHMNFIQYRNYQLMIAYGQISYKGGKGISDEKVKEEFMGGIYNPLYPDAEARMCYVAEMYSDRNSALAVISGINAKKNADVINKVISRLEAINPNYAPLVKYKKDQAQAKANQLRLEIGQAAPQFSFPTPEGDKNIGLADFKGKILVVDFWASWCGPCRSEIPHVKEVYAKYKDKGVAILSVSIDKKDADWKKALAEEKMPWPQVCAPGAGKDIMKEYQFSGIPYIILLDKDGKILAKGLRGLQVDEAIDAALKAK